MPSTPSMPMNAGSSVSVWNTGTQHRPPTPRQNMMMRSLRVIWLMAASRLSVTLGRSPFRCSCITAVGTMNAMNEGTIISLITPSAVIILPFHSMIVVTSPMGENAPPALAAMITQTAYQMRSLGSCTSLRSIIIMTIEVVRLSSTADSIAVMNAIFQRSERLVFDANAPRTQLKPPCWSTISTIVMAPMRKNNVVPASPRFFSMASLSSKPGRCNPS